MRKVRNAKPDLRCAAAAAVACVLTAACATAPLDDTASAGALAARIEKVLAHRGLGTDVLSVIDNILRHEPQASPRAAPPLVRELLAQPTQAADAGAVFHRAVPQSLRHLVDELSAQPQALPVPGGVPASLRDLLDAYVGDLAEARRHLLAAARGTPIDGQALILGLRERLPPASQLRAITESVDPTALDHASALFLAATGRFVSAVRAAGGSLVFPEQAVRYDSAVGVVIIGTRGGDVHGPAAAVIVDPGGNDTYLRAPATGGAVSVIVDLEGDDRYGGSDLAVRGLSAIIDLAGDDAYAMTGPGLGAAIAGTSVLVDLSGDDTFAADLFAQGAAAYGVGALIDLGGNDRYRVRAGGQGFGTTGGIGLLWDRAGDDSYIAEGLPDPYDRGGGLSFAQGAAFGYRAALGGGVGILLDDAGHDTYEAELYAQGAGYYYGVGLLWDGGGGDRYRAARYAQGCGVHEAVGILRDESGDDHYELSVGVGQGMGLDLAVGVLFDGEGDDRYRAPTIAQGTATANGVGLLSDSGGADWWEIGTGALAWGRAGRLRGLPSVGLLLYDPGRAVFALAGKPVPPPRGSAPAGPPGDERAAHRCPEAAPAVAGEALPLADALRRIAPGFAGGSVDPAIYAEVRRRILEDLPASVAELPADDFDAAWSFGEALRCVLGGAPPADAETVWQGIERVLERDPGTPLAGMIAGVLREQPAPGPQMERMLQALDRHPSCGVRTAALRLRYATAADAALRAQAAAAAQAALHSPCWQLQAAARDVLETLGVAPGAAALPSFLRGQASETATSDALTQ